MTTTATLLSGLQSSLNRRHWRGHGAEQELASRAATQARQGRSRGADNDDDEPQNSTSIALGPHSARAGPGRFRRHSKAARRSLAEATRSGPARVPQVLPSPGSRWQLALLCLVALALRPPQLSEARSIDDSAPPIGRLDFKASANGDIQHLAANGSDSITTTTKPAGAQPQPPRTISTEALNDLIERVTAAFTSQTSTPTPAERSTLSPSAAPREKNTGEHSETEDASRKTPSTASPRPAEATTEAPTTTTEEDDSTGAGDDDNDAEDCQGLSSGPSAPGEGPSDNERLVNLQTCLQKKVKTKLMSSARSSMELFDKLSLSGPCTASLLSLMSGLGELKGFAFKFLDASAKIPSGMMSGLLSDFGDFEQCVSIRSNPRVDPRDEAEEGTFSGKYCLLNIRMRYMVKLGPNATAPDGIIPDGVLWDELVRNYWTSNSSKGFQVGVCVPSRCDRDDLTQMLNLLANSYHVHGELGACQDSNDLRRQQQPDLVQLVIIYAFLTILALNLAGTCVDRRMSGESGERKNTSLALRLLICFSIRRNWHIFLRRRGGHSIGGPIDSLDGMSSLPGGRHRNFKKLLPASVSTDTEDGAASGCMSTAESRSSAASSLLSSLPSGGLTSMNSSAKLCERLEFIDAKPVFQPLTIKILPESSKFTNGRLDAGNLQASPISSRDDASALLSHLWGLKLLVIVWITVGHSFLYPSANNYQHYRSIINMNITRNSVWFATTNFILGIDMLLYMTGLMFVHKLAQPSSSSRGSQQVPTQRSAHPVGPKIARLIAWKVLRFWPIYLSVIALAIVIPLASNGPMWPEMVSRRLGETCRANWWANLLMINNLLDSSRVCLPSSWFISVLMQCFLVGSGIVALANRHSQRVAMVTAALLVCVTSSISFRLAYVNKLNAPAIRMDESFVMELDENIFKMYTSTLSNLGPFLVGVLGGFVLLQSESGRRKACTKEDNASDSSALSMTERLSRLMFQLNLAFAMALLATVVLSSVFFTSYTPFWSALYWSSHRVGWAVVTGYLIHQCATGKWQLLRDLLSLSSFIPLGRLIFIAYLVHPMFIHIHSGLVRDGLHVSLYNMLNIYITRLVMSFALALGLHLFIELPFCSMEQSLLGVYLERKLSRCERRIKRDQTQSSKAKGAEHGQADERVTDEPLLAVAPKQNAARREEDPGPDQSNGEHP